MRKIHHCGIKINKYYESGAEFLLNNNGNDNYFDIKEVEVYKIKKKKKKNLIKGLIILKGRNISDLID